jgi:prolactin regulatory element-binding protein
MRPHHTQHSLPFPVHSATFVASDKLVVGGGGGWSKSGIKNKLVFHPTNYVPYQNSPVLQRLYSIGPERSIDLKSEIEVEDAPTSMTVDQEASTGHLSKL